MTQSLTPRLAPVAFVDLTVHLPRATEASPPRKASPLRTRARARRRRGSLTLSEKEGAVVGAEEGERASDSKCRHVKQRGKCQECRGEGEAAGGEGREREEPETQRRDKRARTTQPRTTCPHN
jgi:hypothetical protein